MGAIRIKEKTVAPKKKATAKLKKAKTLQHTKPLIRNAGGGGTPF
jgi:hypothetical protein